MDVGDNKIMQKVIRLAKRLHAETDLPKTTGSQGLAQQGNGCRTEVFPPGRTAPAVKLVAGPC